MGLKKRDKKPERKELSSAPRSLGMSLGDLIELLGQAEPNELARRHLETCPSAVQDDSRLVKSGDLFVAVRGMRSDGHDYASSCVERGAAALVVERFLDLEVPQILVPNGGKALGVLAAHAVGQPDKRLQPVGITGTNGKTTTSYLVEAMLTAADRRPGLIGTVSYRWGGRDRKANYTTPTPIELQSVLREMIDDGCDSAVLEVSSAALHMDRLMGTHFQVAAFSNLSQDHLDVHQTMEEYGAAKARLFRDHLVSGGCAVINIDDPASEIMLAAVPEDCRILRVSRRGNAQAELRVLDYESSIRGIVARIKTPRGVLRIEAPALLGHYNVDNIALAVGIGEAMELAHADIAGGIAAMTGVPGRVERVPNELDLQILVDYAHTPDALANVLGALRPLTEGRLICVFGCGGDRDPDKRPMMGAAVAEGADLAIVTSDNPRSEEPAAIIGQILPAVPDPFYVDVDRRRAIQAAVGEATPKDVVLIAGKGHEDYQILANETIHFDDRIEAARACELRPSYTLAELVDCVEGDCSTADTRLVQRIVIDTRILAPGDLYVAIQGERFDGHQFVEQAADAGAVGVVVEKGRGIPLEGCAVIEVEDPRVALGRMARLHRRRWQGTLIAITGSAGKTTTKELIKAAVGEAAPVHAAVGSNNNETGVPLTLLGLRAHHSFGVVEMGMRGLGEIDYLTQIAEPDVAVVVNAGTAHIGRLGSRDAIAKAKSEIYGGLGPEGTAIVPGDDPRLMDLSRSAATRVRFGDARKGVEAEVSLQAYELSSEGQSALVVDIRGERFDIRLPLAGEHNALNACCALAAAVAAGVQPAVAARGIERTAVPSMRSERAVIAGRHVLLDCYNANPASTEAALRTLADLRKSQKSIAVLGDMLELGEHSAASHHAMGRLCAELETPLIGMGEERRTLAQGCLEQGGTAWTAADPLAAARAALAATDEGDWILLKASRGMKLERVAQCMRQESGDAN